ncbi:hypothetical protein K0H59_07225 [Shewanella sp. FJAT-51649]|uniref:hypothetical protein n=1 Tax=Shewanella sp. FJAT-51649 TaxID=2864210 RepID=UPI001C657BC8|nr:hypothetical protein [Shewanella sp. FJAT-51649]QYJ72811.1 hypothetical protein K0H59_07225 [Shewanella sp. FJAT-51649]
MQQDNINKSGLAAEKMVKAAWSKPEIEVIDVGTTAAKVTNGGESSLTGPS